MGRGILGGVLVAAIVVGASAGEDASGRARLDGFRELLKVPGDKVPLPESCRPFISFSPDERRYMVLFAKQGLAIPHLGKTGAKAAPEPVPWDRRGIWTTYCRLCLAGRPWSADSQRVLFLHPVSREDRRGWETQWHRTMFPYAMRWDMPNPQCGRPRHMVLKDKGETGCTAASYSHDGKALFTAFSDPRDFRSCGVTEMPAVGEKRRGRVLYRKAGGAIYHLVPSPDDKRLAWIETHSRKAKPIAGPEVVIVDRKSAKVLRRIALSEHVWGWADAQPPVWSADGKAICYGSVVQDKRFFRREVRLAEVDGKGDRLLLRDGLAVGATPAGIVVQRGARCQPAKMGIVSFVDPGHPIYGKEEVTLCPTHPDAGAQTLIEGAFVQQVIGRRIVFAQRDGDRVVVKSAEIRPPTPRTRPPD